MKWQVPDFDITRFDSNTIDMNTPGWLAKRLLSEIISNEISEQNGDALFESIDEMHLRLVTDAVLAASLSTGPDMPLWAKEVSKWPHDDWDTLGGPIVQEAENLQYMKINGCIVLMMPRIKSENDSRKIVSVLNEIAEKEGPIVDWIVDMYTVHPIPSSLFAYLLGFQYSLKQKHRQLYMLWLRKESVNTDLMPAVKKHFHLMSKGAFLLSKLEPTTK